MKALIASFLLVLLAEMGDKTQLLAMAFAAKYSAQKVLVAVFLATLINHALAVVTGHFLAAVIPLDIIAFIAALSFVGFGLWTIRGDELEGEDKRVSRFGPVVTVGIAFFLAEMGDKTQLATVSLAVEYGNMVAVLAGTTLAMVTADAIGILAGVVMRRHIPERAIKWFSAVVFIVFGLHGVYRLVASRAGALQAWVSVVALGAAAGFAARYLIRRRGRS